MAGQKSVLVLLWFPEMCTSVSSVLTEVPVKENGGALTCNTKINFLLSYEKPC